MKELNVVRTCAILHDVGKPECWANGKPWSQHIHWTYKIVKESLGEDLAFIAMRHHSGRSYSPEHFPQTELEKIICLADNLASGADRPEEPRRGTRRPEPPVHLTHVLSDGRKIVKEVNAAELAYAAEEIKKNLSEIGKDFDKDPANAYLRIYNFLENYAFLHSIPADTRAPINDVSLWEHLKLTAAFATCIWLNGGYRGDDAERYMFCLLSGDADKVSQYIGMSSRLPDLDARSARIRRATMEAGSSVRKMLGPECLIYAGGGGFLALCPEKKAESVANIAKEAFEKATDGEVTITVSLVATDGNKARRDFGGFWNTAMQQLRISKLRRPISMRGPMEEANVCDVCHLRPATKEDPLKVLPIDASPRPEVLCDICWQLRQEGTGASLDQIRAKTDFVAVLRADGDSVGEVLGGKRFEKIKKTTTPSRLSAVSRLIHDVCEGNLKRTIEDFEGECLFAGGDDVLAVLAGERALEASMKLASIFKERMAGECTMSAGVAIFHSKLPIYVGLDAAQTLISMAKGREGKNSVAFAVIGGAGLTPDKLEKTVQPYGWSELEKMLEIAEFLQESGLPTSQIRRISRAAKEDPEEAEIWIWYLMGREIIPWSRGNELISYLKSRLLSDAFTIYNTFRVR